MDRLRDRLALVAEGEGGPEALAAQRLIASLDDSVRLMLFDVLASAAAEITRELAPRSVELRLRGGDPEFVVSAPAGDADPAAIGRPAGEAPASGEALAGGEGAVARINLRLPEQLKARVEHAAEQEGLSINAWLVRAVAAGVERGRSGGGPEPSTRLGQRYTGWGR